MNIISINQIFLHVKKLDKSLEFYKGVLHLNHIEKPEYDYPVCMLELNETQHIYLLEGRKHKVNSGPESTHFSLEVKSIKDMEKQFIRNNMAYTGPKVSAEGNYQLFIHDPDGYCLEFYQPKIE